MTAKTECGNGQANPITLAGEDGSYVLQLAVGDGGFECRASVTVQQASLALSPNRLLGILKEIGIIRGLLKEPLLDLCNAVRRGVSLHDVVVARGSLPVAGPDGVVEFCDGIYSDHPEFTEDEDGSIDFRQLHIFGNVIPGQLIGVLRPPGKGSDGVSVTGEIYPAPSGAPLGLVVGEGVRPLDDVGNLYADLAGRVLFDGSTLMVTESYLIDGDVDMEVGHIDFVGFVEVRGDVLDGFNIRAGRGLKVGGIVGACQIFSGGDVEVRGMAGKGQGKLVCQGNLLAHFLNDADVEVAGQILVHNEIRNSVVKCSGIVSVPKGSIAGGECIALGGIEANRVGAPSGLATDLEIGVDYRVLGQMKELRARLIEVSRILLDTNSILALLNDRFNNSSAPLTSAEKVRIVELAEKLDRLDAEHKYVSAEIERLQNSTCDRANGKLNVTKLLLEGVAVAIGKAREEIKNERSGPLSIIENSVDHQLRFLPLSPLGKSAQTLEKEMLQ